MLDFQLNPSLLKIFIEYGVKFENVLSAQRCYAYQKGKNKKL